jgi:catechol 2,3-dioxygenase-like lactoylglutathione lyase family enzyme
MLTDHWDISHICIAVPDLEAAMTEYSAAFGVRWSPLLDYSGAVTLDVASPLHGHGATMLGLREVLSRDGAAAIAGGPPFAGLELAHAEPFSPAWTIWGCPDKRQYVHHICYWVDDIEAESAHLVEHGLARELTVAPGDRARGFAYHVSPGGFRIELMRREDKAAIAGWFATGELELEWA